MIHARLWAINASIRRLMLLLRENPHSIELLDLAFRIMRKRQTLIQEIDRGE